MRLRKRDAESTLIDALDQVSFWQILLQKSFCRGCRKF
jgi:hypothetical protein